MTFFSSGSSPLKFKTVLKGVPHGRRKKGAGEVRGNLSTSLVGESSLRSVFSFCFARKCDRMLCRSMLASSEGLYLR